MLAPSHFELYLFGAFRPEGAAREVAAAVSLRSLEKRLLFSGRSFAVTAVVDLHGVAARAEARGQLDLRRAGVLGTPTRALRLEFRGGDGKTLELTAARELDPRHPFFSLSRWLGEIRHEGGEWVGAVELRQDFRRQLGRYLIG